MSTPNSEGEGMIVMSGWAQKQRDPKKHMTGLVLVVGTHLFVLWLILSGVGQKFVKAVVPVSIAEVILPPEPPEPPPPPPPKKPKPDTPPPPDFVPVSEVAPTMTTSAPVIQAVSTPPPAQVYVPAPPAPRPTGPRGFGSITNRKDCAAAFQASYPREARRAGTEGTVTLAITVGPDGKATGVEVANANPRRVFDRAAMGVITGGACRFEPDSAGYTAQLAITYKLSGEEAE